MKVRIVRSREFCRSMAIADGRDHCEAIDVVVAPGDLSRECREALVPLLPVAAVWPEHLETIGYQSNGCLMWGYSGWGRELILLDSDAPSPDELSSAILAAVYRAGETSRKLAARNELLAEKSRLLARVAEIDRATK